METKLRKGRQRRRQSGERWSDEGQENRSRRFCPGLGFVGTPRLALAFRHQTAPVFFLSIERGKSQVTCRSKLACPLRFSTTPTNARERPLLIDSAVIHNKRLRQQKKRTKVSNLNPSPASDTSRRNLQLDQRTTRPGGEGTRLAMNSGTFGTWTAQKHTRSL